MKYNQVVYIDTMNKERILGMKKLLIIVLAVVLSIGLPACNSKNDVPVEKQKNEESVKKVDQKNEESNDKITDEKDEESKKEDKKEKSKSEAFPFELITKDDQIVKFTHVPERVLSVNVNTGEQLMALGLGDKIIGTAYNNDKMNEKYREDYDKIPVIAEKSPSLEVVLNQNPDFIYGRSSAFSDKDTAIATHDKLTELEIMSLSSIEGYKLGCDVEDVYQDFYNLGRIFQVEDRAEELVNRMKKNIEETKAKVKDFEPVRVFNFDAKRDDGAFTPGNNFTSKLIRHAGGVNVFEDLEKTWNNVSWEAVIEKDPEVIIVNDYGSTPLEEKLEFLKTNEAIKDISAIKNGRIFSVSLPDVFANSRIDETIDKLAREFHPEAFK